MKYLFPLNPFNQQRQFQKPVWVYPAHLAMYATYLRNEGHDVYWGHVRGLGEEPSFDKIIHNDFEIDVPFDKLPYPDRIFTDAKNKRWQAYGNYKFHPATHMMVSNLCWYGKCTFCIDTEKLKTEKRGVRPVDYVLEEIDDLIKNGYREVFDDSGTFPAGQWLTEFCRAMIMSGKNKKIVLGCNMRMIENLDYSLMRRAGFRMILVGIESAKQETLDKIKKGISVKDIMPVLKKMAEAGLEPHGTVMFGYPWETTEDAEATVSLIHDLLRKGWLKTVQASVFMPPRTKPDPNHPAQRHIHSIYDAYKKPWYWRRKIKDVKCWEDVTYLSKRIHLIKGSK